MIQIKDDPTKRQQKTVQDQTSVSESNRGGQSSGIDDDIFEAIQNNFDQTFNTTATESAPKISTQQITTEAIKQAPQTNRSARKLKPIYTTLVKKQSPSKDQNLNSDIKSDGQDQRVFSRQKRTPNIKATSNESEQKSEKSSPYAKIMGRLHQSAVSEYYPHQTHPTSIQDIHTQRKNNKALQGNQVQDKSFNHTSASPRALNYKDLQQKIESALKKNSHYKAFTSRLNKSNLTSRTFNQCNEMMLSRFQQYEKNREREIQQKKSELKQRKEKQLKFHPKINKKSIQFVQQMGGHQPLQNRYQKILEQKSKRLQQYEEQKKQKEEEEYEMFMQEFLKHQKSPEDSTRSYEKFYEEMFKWKQRSKKNAQEKKRVMEENQLKETNTFHPKINKNSCKIVMNSTKSEKKIPIYERQVPGEKKFKSKIDEQCTFKPKINKRRIK